MSKRRQYRCVKVVPSQRVLLLWGGVAPHWAKRGGNLYANGWAVRWRSGPWTTVFTLCFAHLSPLLFYGGDFDNLINSIFRFGRTALPTTNMKKFPVSLQVKIGPGRLSVSARRLHFNPIFLRSWKKRKKDEWSFSQSWW